MKQQTIDEQILAIFRVMEGPAAEATTVGQIHKAAKDMGHRPEDPLRWALKFAGQDLDTLSGPARLDLALKIAAFRVNPFRLFGASAPDEKLPVGEGVFFPSREQVREIHAGFDRLFNEYTREGETAFEYHLPPGKKIVNVTLHRLPDGQAVFSIHAEDYVADCVIKLLRIMERFAHLIRICPPQKHGCGKVFLASRKDNIYCSTACVNRSTTRERRARLRSDKKRRAS